ncbi:MAG TPA: hypothetical protein VMZ50_09440 [Phycisphaerae bacterium]|nr:hypothetical protein [Phycisphaerae bacterium]
MSNPLGNKPGDRVGAVLSATDGVVRLLGYGVYEGDHAPEGRDKRVPRIVLDSGDVVWGSDCGWWGPEERIREQVAKYVAREWEVVEGPEKP